MTRNPNELQPMGVLPGLAILMCFPCLLAPLLIGAGISSILAFLGKWAALLLIVTSFIGFVLYWRRKTPRHVCDVYPKRKIEEKELGKN